jgi:DNA-binding transcriptional ArsR family regulator
MTDAAQQLDAVFHALANPVRRAVVERLARGPSSVSELAKPFDMAMPSFLQHIQVLEEDGLVRSSKRGRVRTVQMVPHKLRRATDWLEKQRAVWEQRRDQLDDYLRTLKDQGQR